MTEETRAQAARMATDILIAAIGNNELLGALKVEVGIGIHGKAGPLSLFDKVYDHLLDALAEPAGK